MVHRALLYDYANRPTALGVKGATTTDPDGNVKDLFAAGSAAMD
jgi:hypothetical protein